MVWYYCKLGAMPVRKFKNFSFGAWQKESYEFVHKIGNWREERLAEDYYVDYLLGDRILELILEKRIHLLSRSWLKLLDENGVDYDIAMVQRPDSGVYYLAASPIQYRSVDISIMLCLDHHAEVLLRVGCKNAS